VIASASDVDEPSDSATCRVSCQLSSPRPPRARGLAAWLHYAHAYTHVVDALQNCPKYALDRAAADPQEVDELEETARATALRARTTRARSARPGMKRSSPRAAAARMARRGCRRLDDEGGRLASAKRRTSRGRLRDEAALVARHGTIAAPTCAPRAQAGGELDRREQQRARGLVGVGELAGGSAWRRSRAGATRRATPRYRVEHAFAMMSFCTSVAPS